MRGILQVARPSISSIAGAVAGAVTVVHYDGSGAETTIAPLCAFLTVTTLTMFGFIINDVHDRHKDRLAFRLDKPIASGCLSVSAGNAAALIAFGTSIGLSSYFGLASMGVVAITSLLLFGYSRFAQRVPLLKGAYTAVLTLSPAVWGWAATGHLAPFVTLLGIFLFMFGREVLLDVHDMEADRKSGLETIPLVYGAKAARNLAWGLMFCTPLLPMVFEYQRLVVFLCLTIMGLLITIKAFGMSIKREAVWTKLPMLVSIGLLI